MKNTRLLVFIQSIALLLCIQACSKNNAGINGGTSPTTFVFSANDSLVNYPVGNAYIQDVDNLQTLLITGQYADTSSKQGSISIRITADTAGRYAGSSLLITYTSAAGIAYTNAYDSSNYVQITQLDTSQNGKVRGVFSLKLGNGADSIQLNQGSFTVPFQN